MVTKELLSPDVKTAKDMTIFYHCFNWVLAKPLEILAYARILDWNLERVKALNITELISDAQNQLDDPDKVWTVGAIFIGSRVYSGLVRRTGTKIIGEHYGVDTKRARFLTLMPYGEWTAIVDQVTTSVRKRLFI